MKDEALRLALEALENPWKAGPNDVFIIKPKHLIVPPAIYRRLMWRPPIRKARNIRGRKRALSRRPTPVLWKMMKGSV